MQQHQSRPSTRTTELWAKVLERHFGVPIAAQSRGWPKVLARLYPPKACTCK